MPGLLDLPGQGLLSRKQRLRSMGAGYEDVPRTHGLLDPAHEQMAAAEAHMAANPQPDLPLLHDLAILSSPIPVVGDVLGVAELEDRGHGADWIEMIVNKALTGSYN